MNESKDIDIKDLETITELNCGVIIVKLYKVPFRYKCNRNITGENEQGQIIWQVDDVSPLSDAPFMEIKPFSKEKIIASNWIGVDYCIDINTGSLEIVNKNAARPW